MTALGVVKDLVRASLPSMLIRLVRILSWMEVPYILVSHKCKVIAAKFFLTTKGEKAEKNLLETLS